MSRLLVAFAVLLSALRISAPAVAEAAIADGASLRRTRW
jgi:hypothetical protein